MDSMSILMQRTPKEIEYELPIAYQRVGSRGGSRTAATSKVELFVIIVNGWKPLTIITKSSILDVAAVLDPPLGSENYYFIAYSICFGKSGFKFVSNYLTHYMPLGFFYTL